MRKEYYININKLGWNRLIESKAKYSNISLPDYGPFLKRGEEQLQLLGNIKNKKILELGCGSGKSLQYLNKKGATDLWGLDISDLAIENVKKIIPSIKEQLITSPMEEEVNIPNNYFDIAISIYSIGYTSDIDSTFKNVYKYLKQDGVFIISWTHPFFNCLTSENEKVIMKKSYYNEKETIITKGNGAVELVQTNLMISSIISFALKNGFTVEDIIEEECESIEDKNSYQSNFFTKDKIKLCPTTIIYKFKKKGK